MRPRRAGNALDPAPAPPIALSATTRVRVAGLALSLRAAAASPALELPPPLRPFACRRGADIRLELSAAPVPRPGRDALLFDSGGVWRAYRWDGGLLYTFRTPLLEPPVYKGVAIDGELRRGTVYFPPQRGRPRRALDFPLDELLFQHRLAQEGGMEVHACALVVDGRAALFCGRSGAGKSTTARLWRRLRPGTPVLSDDRVAIRLQGGRPIAHGTPWHGDGGFATPAGRPLAAVFFLRHGRRTRLTPLAPGAAAARLFSRSFPPPWDPVGIGRVLEACAAVAASRPCYELRFRPDRQAVDAVIEALR